ncbi:MAG: hypothetical protein C5S38_08035 [Candidatus Methanophagaceae archaeon]|nr:MAG: hypothetical protein C5S38_08035 [Methanophagales archaeon]
MPRAAFITNISSSSLIRSIDSSMSFTSSAISLFSNMTAEYARPTISSDMFFISAMRSAISSPTILLLIPGSPVSSASSSFSLYSWPVAILQNAGIPSVGPEIIAKSPSLNFSSPSGKYIHLDSFFIANTLMPVSVSSFKPFKVLSFNTEAGVIFTFTTASSKSLRSR